MQQLPTAFQQYIHISRYSRWLDHLGRRETWPETVHRYCNFFANRVQNPKLEGIIWDEVYPAILNLEVMPSMRALMTAGEALDRDNIAGFNCAYVAVSKVKHFSEIFHILLNGTGVGFSCEAYAVNKLPTIPKQFIKLGDEETLVIRDSKRGWSEAYRDFVQYLFDGYVIPYDTSRIREAGARLKTFGGRASGPKPVQDLFEYTKNLITGAAGRKLTTVEVHGLVCKIASVVVVGGVRRSALISLSDLDDEAMAVAKSGEWYIDHGEYALANNSAVYNTKPTMYQFIKEWSALVRSGSGERGIFNREAAQKQAARWNKRPYAVLYGCNPCSEIILRDDGQMCNLSEVVVRANDTVNSLKKKVRIATILGTLQSTLTDFKFLSEEWINNTKNERLLGVSLTGICDNAITNGSKNIACLPAILDELREYTTEVNAEYADLLGIEHSTAITCVKPSGTVSSLVDSASGMHARHSQYYIRTVRTDKKDPVYHYMKDAGVPVEDCAYNPETTAVFSFPIEAPKGAMLREDKTAIEQLELWLLYQRHWCHHKPSVTISVKESEWMDVGAWVYKNFDELSGVSFLPYSEHTYKQAPYQELTAEQFADWKAQHPEYTLDWAELAKYETTDCTTGAQEYACSSGSCEIL